MKRSKPRGKTGPIKIGSGGVSRQLIDFPATKDEMEFFIAKLFCAGNSGMRPQITRYGHFDCLEQQSENALDFRVVTALGKKWLELAEFAPLDQFGHAYDGVPDVWPVDDMRAAVRNLIDKKASKRYGPDVILILYKTHETLFIPPPILRAIRDELTPANVPFEAIYFVSPHDQQSASAWEIYPGDPSDNGPRFRGGKVHIGFKGFKPANGS